MRSGSCLVSLGIAFTLCGLASAQNGGEPALIVRGFANEHGDRPELTPDRIIVSFRVPVVTAQLDAALAAVQLRRVGDGVDGAFTVIQVPPQAADAWVAWFGRQDIVAYAERDALAYTTATPNDPFFSPYQWNFFNVGTVSANAVSNFGVNGVAAWDRSTGVGVTVAVVDTGVAYETFGAFARAPDLAGRVFVSPWNFVNNTSHANDDNGHGTHVAGTIGQVTNNGLGVAGLANGCSIMPVKVLNSQGNGSYSAISNGIIWAADHGAAVINLSLSGTIGSVTLQNAVNYAWGAGAVICAATGNSGSGSGVQYPARYTNCIAVGATRFDGNRASYSTFGTGIDVVAPGGQTSLDQNGDGYGDGILQQTFAQGSPTVFSYYFFQGTSMATPHVSAIAALVKAYRGYSNALVRSAIESSCRDRGAAGYDTTYGWGLVDANGALNR